MKHFIFIFSIFLLSTNADDIRKHLEKVCKTKNFPAIAYAVTKNGRIIAKDIVGVRKFGSDVKATINDKFHMGSCTKAMTSILAGIFVDERKIKWNTTLGEVFPEINTMHKTYKKVTLEQLLSHTGGVPNIFQHEKKLWAKLYTDRLKEKPLDQRMYMLQEVTKKKPKYTPGRKFHYSNCSTSFAGMMLEKIAQKPYEELLLEKFAKPLDMKTLGFGCQASSGPILQPYPHTIKGGKTIPEDVRVLPDNPPAIAPAGLAHCSVLDFAKFASFLSQKGKGLVEKATFEEIAKPRRENYALGIMRFHKNWGGQVLHHNGTNTMNFAVMWISLDKQASVVAVTNCDGPKVLNEIDSIVAKLIIKYIQ